MRRKVNSAAKLPLKQAINPKSQTANGITPKELVGWPGYRNQYGHSGYDPVEAFAELGHMIGLFFHHLFYFTLRTTNLMLLFFMAGIGVLSFIPLIISVMTEDKNSTSFLITFGISLLVAAMGGLLIVNLLINLSTMRSTKR